MALFTLLYSYSDDAEAVARHRPEHRAYLKGLHDAGTLVAAGPLGEPGPPRGLLVLDVADATEVESVAAADPFTARGMIVDHVVGAWTLSFGADRFEEAIG